MVQMIFLLKKFFILTKKVKRFYSYEKNRRKNLHLFSLPITLYESNRIKSYAAKTYRVRT